MTDQPAETGNPFANVTRKVTPAEIAEDLAVIDRANARAREAEERRNPSASPPVAVEVNLKEVR